MPSGFSRWLRRCPWRPFHFQLVSSLRDRIPQLLFLRPPSLLTVGNVGPTVPSCTPTSLRNSGGTRPRRAANRTGSDTRSAVRKPFCPTCRSQFCSRSKNGVLCPVLGADSTPMSGAIRIGPGPTKLQVRVAVTGHTCGARIPLVIFTKT